MNADNQKTVLLEDVLTELALAQDIPDAALLDEYTRRFPQYAEALTSYAIDLAVEAAIEPPSSVVPTPETSALAMRAMSRFQNRKFEVHTRKPTVSTAPPTVANPIAAHPLALPYVRRDHASSQLRKRWAGHRGVAVKLSMIGPVRVWMQLQTLAARLGVRVDELLGLDAAEVQRRLRGRQS